MTTRIYDIYDLSSAFVEPTAPTTAAAGMPPRLRDETPSHSLLVLKINTRAYAELERLAREGLDGDDPADVARTLLLEGLRRRAVVRPSK